MVGRRRFFQGLGAAAGAAALAPSLVSQAQDLEIHRLPRSVAGHEIEGAFTYLGAVVLRMRDDSGQQYQIDILARGGAQGVRDTSHYSLFLANRGNGNKATDETHGASLIAIADWLESERPNLPAVMTFEERSAAHPNGNFLLPS